MAENTLTAGVARVDITPPVGFRMQGIMRRTEPSVGVHMPLTATALVLADDNHKIAVIDCDLIGFDLALADEVRRTVADRIGTPTSHVTVACTHTHNGPCTVRTCLGGPHDIAPRPGEIESLDAYIAKLVDKLAGLASVADGSRRPARSGSGRGEALVNINREEMMEDGRVWVGRNPDGITDHGVDVLRIDDLDGRPIAVVCSFAAHPVVMGMNSFLLGPDYPGVVRQTVEQITGATCLFLTGAAGNQATIEFLQHDWNEVERIGGVIGCEVAKTAIGIETRPHRVVKEATVSAANLALYSKQFHDGPTHRVLNVASRKAIVPLQPMPSLEEAEAQQADALRDLEDSRRRGVSEREMVPVLMMERWARGALEKVQAGVTQEDLSFEIVGYRLDDFVLVAMPGEPFIEIALGVKERAKAAHVMFGGYANGDIAYWPSPETVAIGGMAVEASVKTYNISAAPITDTVDILVGEFGGLLDDLGL
ncbi:MAG: hypothetical protein QF467_04785 [SAR202 cluster bacterium]|mgnify:CR=1 FL=1|nr:hypothetical protein [SAR202 cluster bacterium]